jgi:hypothetical protein
MGLWLIVTAFFRMDKIDCMKYNLLVGSLIAIVGWRMKAAKPWQGWLSVVMGVWFAVAVFFPPFDEGEGFLWNNVIGGTLVAIIGLTALGGGSEIKTINTTL